MKMKSIDLLLVFLVFTGSSASMIRPHSNTVVEKVEVTPFKWVNYAVVSEKSSIKWKGRKITYSHYGTINLDTGYLKVSARRVIGGEFTLDMNSMLNLDLTDEAKNKKLIGHLKSKDFFDVKNYPVSTFIIASIRKQESDLGNYAVTGNLTIKGITQEISFPAKIQVDDQELVANATIVFDRSLFDVRYNSSSFFENLGDQIIYDDIEMEVSLLARKL